MIYGKPMAELALEPPNHEIPDKLYFRIGEVSKLTGLKPYVLRFWESEFSGLGPKKSGTGHRLYRRKDVELVFEIKRLLYDRRFTIEGARKWLGDHNKTVRTQEPPKVQGELFPSTAPDLSQIRSELMEILEILK